MAVPDIASPTAANNARLMAVKDADIDGTGTFKYILIKVHDCEVDEDYRYIVRGTAAAGYHMDIYDSVVAGIEEKGLECEVMGGGRIEHDPSKKTIRIYGYSVGYGQANHAITQAVLQGSYPGYRFTLSNDGY